MTGRPARLALLVLVCCLHAGGASWPEQLAVPSGEPGGESLRELSALAEYYRRPPAGIRPEAGNLDAVLAALPEAGAEEPPSLWERFRNWLLSVLGEDDPLPPWLEDLALPDEAVKWVWYSAVILIVLLALAIVVNEIRIYSRRRAPGARPAPAGASTPDRVPERPSADGSGEQLEALFRAIVGRLQAVGALPPRPSLTHREVAAARGLSRDQQSAVETLSRAAERAVYGAWDPRPAEVAPALAAGRHLLEDLNRRPS